LNDLGHNLVGGSVDRKVELIVRLAIGSLVHKLHQANRGRPLERGDVYPDRLRGGTVSGRPGSRTRGGPGTGSPRATARERKRQSARGERRGKPPERRIDQLMESLARPLLGIDQADGGMQQLLASGESGSPKNSR